MQEVLNEKKTHFQDNLFVLVDRMKLSEGSSEHKMFKIWKLFSIVK